MPISSWPCNDRELAPANALLPCGRWQLPWKQASEPWDGSCFHVPGPCFAEVLAETIPAVDLRAARRPWFRVWRSWHFQPRHDSQPRSPAGITSSPPPSINQRSTNTAFFLASPHLSDFYAVHISFPFIPLLPLTSHKPKGLMQDLTTIKIRT